MNGTVSFETVQGQYLIGAQKVGSTLAATTDATILSVNGPRDHVKDVLIQGYGSPNVSTQFGATQPVINMGANCVECGFPDLYITGGSYAILAGGTDFIIGPNTSTLFTYGNAVIDVTGGGYLIRVKDDTPYPVSQPAFASVATPIAWQASRAYSGVGTTFVTLTQGGQTYWLQLAQNGTSGRSAPTLLAYELNINDGTAVWQLVAPTNLALLRIEPSSTVMNITDPDFTGVSDASIDTSGSSVQIVQSTFGAEMNVGFRARAGAGLHISNSQLARRRGRSRGGTNSQRRHLQRRLPVRSQSGVAILCRETRTGATGELAARKLILPDAS